MEISARLPVRRSDRTMNPFCWMVRVREALLSRWRNVWFRLLGVRISGYVWMRRISIPRNWSDVELNASVSLDEGVILLCSGTEKRGKLRIGRKTYINRYTMLDAHELIAIGDECMIGPFCYITDADHGTATGIPLGQQPMMTRPVVLQQGVWVGAGAKILKGVCVGSHAIIAAGAVVTRDVPAGMIVAGIPARVIGKRGE
jgi:acetyltransferase-like isoleucine patch superfamily enzyme